MSKQPFINSILITLSLFFPLAGKALAADQTAKIKGPVIITSEKLTADNKARTAVFEHSVMARTPDMIMYSDRMIVYYETNSGDIKRIEAGGNVKVIKEDRVITSREATYHADAEKIIFTGDPRAVEGENVVTGRTMIYLINEDQFHVEGSKVFLTKKRE